MNHFPSALILTTVGFMLGYLVAVLRMNLKLRMYNRLWQRQTILDASAYQAAIQALSDELRKCGGDSTNVLKILAQQIDYDMQHPANIEQAMKIAKQLRAAGLEAVNDKK